jgi:hypothetical protein
MNRIFYLIGFFILSGCAYNVADEEDMGPPVSYSQQVKPILVTHCYHCHTDTATHQDRNPDPNVQWNVFENVQKAALKPSSDPRYSKLVAVLKHTEQPFMPFDKLDPLPDSLVNIIHNWAKQGAPNN